MEKDKVPQDDENLLDGKGRELCYAVDENGNYVKVLSVGWAPKNTVLKQGWEVIYEKMEAAKQKILAGELSPIAYYLEKSIMDIKLLADYVGFSKWRVKRHLKPKVFAKLNKEILNKYAEAFNITVEQLSKIE